MAAPTYKDYLNLINVTPNGSPPSPWVSLGVPEVNNSDGFLARAFYNSTTGQIVIAFSGPGTLSGLEVVLNKSNSSSDGLILSGKSPAQLLNDMRRFVQTVKNTANKLNLSTLANNIFVTGHSLGGYEAEVAATENGYGGASFGGPGVIGYVGAPQDHQNFTSYIVDGDPVGNYSRDSQVDISSFDFNIGNHVGNIEYIGSPGNEVLLNGIF